MEMRRVGLAPEKNIPFRCGFNSSLKIWQTKPLQPRWLTSASPVALSVFSVRCARDSLRRPLPARRAAHLRLPAPPHLLLPRLRRSLPRRRGTGSPASRSGGPGLGGRAGGGARWAAGLLRTGRRRSSRYEGRRRKGENPIWFLLQGS